MDKRTTAIIATVATAFLCGLPGCCVFIFGAVTAAGIMPYETDIMGNTSTGLAPTWLGIVLLCLALLLIAIPVAVGFFTLRKKPAVNPVVIDIDDSLPPTS
jgi:hypothetical protein